MGFLITPAVDEELLGRAEITEPALELPDLTAERLAEITRSSGIDLATAVFYDRARKRARNAGFDDESLEQSSARNLSIDLIAVVPGAFHGQHKHTGADGLKIAETVRGLAPAVKIVPVRSFGRLEENAGIILDWLEEHRHCRVLLTSLSKGGSDVKWALASTRAAAAFANVTSWVSFSGIIQGTPLVAWLNARPLRSTAFRMLLRLQGHRAGVLDQLRRADDAPLTGWPTLPNHLQIVHVCGCPLRHHLAHRWAPRGYDRLASLGPNDGGGTLLGDLSRVPGTIVPIWGADHYLQPSWDVTPLLRSVVATAAVRATPRQAR